MGGKKAMNMCKEKGKKENKGRQCLPHHFRANFADNVVMVGDADEGNMLGP